MDFLQKFNNQTEDKDKILRLVQYTAHLVWAFKEDSHIKTKVGRLKEIESAISLSRQMLRFGKSLEAINSSLYSMHLQDNFLRTTISLSRISNGLYLLCDNLVWLSKIGVIKLNEDRISKLASNYWLYSTLLLFTKNIYQMQLIFQNHPPPFDNEYRHKNCELKISAKLLINFASYNKALTFEIVKNLCDICLSLNSSDKINFSPFTIGFVGVLSSLIPILKYKTFS